MDVSPRLARWVSNALPTGTSERVLAELHDLPAYAVGMQDSERVQAAPVVRTGGDWVGFTRMRDLALQDWRDALVAAGLADDAWPTTLTAIFGDDEPGSSAETR